jgi:hypothetical protein
MIAEDEESNLRADVKTQDSGFDASMK